jgi:hypothetical protein
MNHMTWSKTEKAIARRAFEQAYERETKTIMEAVQAKAAEMTQPSQVWDLLDFLRAKQRMLGEKYDYRYSVMDFVLVRLIREGWIKREEIDGLSPEKLSPIDRMLGFAAEADAEEQMS